VTGPSSEPPLVANSGHSDLDREPSTTSTRPRFDVLVSGALYPKDDVLGIAVNPLPKI
jgi:hypothetical protein